MPGEGMQKGRQWLWAVAAILLAAAAYRGFAGAPFLFDDLHTVRDNPHIKEHLSLLYFLSHPESASKIPSTLIRPLLTWTYALDFHRAGAKPEAFRLTNLLLHLLNALLILLLTREAPALRRLAPLGGLLFLLHPLLSVNLACVSNRSTLLSSIFYLAALLLFCRGLAGFSPRRPALERAGIAGQALLFAAGLLSKESAATLPLAALLWFFFFRSPAEKQEARRPTLFFLLASLAVQLAVLALYLLYRQLFAAPVFFPPARPWSVWQYAAAQVPVFWTYVRLMFWPVHLALEHDAWLPRSAGELLSPLFLLSAAGLGLFTTTVFVFRRRMPAVGFAALFSIVYLLPTSSVIPLTMVVNENRPYLSLLFFLWLILTFLSFCRGREKGLGAALAVLFTVMTACRGWTYQKEERVWREAVANAPLLARPHVNLGAVLSSYGRLAAARSSYQRALTLDPCETAALTNLGNLAAREQEWEKAENLYRRALECNPGHVSARVHLADLLLSRQDQEAKKLLERGLELNPREAEILGRLGIIYVRHGEEGEKARALLRAAIENAGDPAQRERWEAELSVLEAKEREKK